MKNQNDLRVIKTKKLIRDAFFELVETNGLEKTTISHIANRANINRATFYLHYQDKQALITSLENEVLEDIEDILSTVTEETIYQSKAEKVPFPHIVQILTYVHEHPHFFNFLVRNGCEPTIIQKIMGLINRKIAEGVFPTLRFEIDLKDYAETIRVAVFSSVICQWVKNGMEESIEELSGLITEIAIGMTQCRNA